MTFEAADTTPEAAELHRRLLMSRSGPERLAMATGMFDSAKRLVESRLRECGITDPVELKIATFRRLYEADLDPLFVQAVVRQIAEEARLRHTDNDPGALSPEP